MVDQELDPLKSVGARKQSGNRSDEARGDEQNRSNASAKKDDTGLGPSLRSIYQQTVEEDIPSEMLDLLKRLD